LTLTQRPARNRAPPDDMLQRVKTPLSLNDAMRSRLTQLLVLPRIEDMY
jgi:hypothetical protein